MYDDLPGGAYRCPKCNEPWPFIRHRCFDYKKPEAMRTCHELKCSNKFYDAVASGQKPFEMRENDRNYRVGDHLWLREIRHQPDGQFGEFPIYTGSQCVKEITYILAHEDFTPVMPGYVILGLKQVLS